jgi:anti-sigma factor ChrR (cupin superfamily)
MQAWQAATKTWVAARVAIMTEYRETVATASATLGAALNSATTKEARKSAMETFKAAREAAKTKLDTALAALGERPVRPTR